ncbi:hypothetical protein [Microcoleus sp. S13_B4]|uniref:hypothetical protein n=1 Tax=Microcoleus sp. S13_B4 TaxID=3055408 RepID=UPI002FCF7EB7
MNKPKTMMELAKQASGWHFDPSIPEKSFREVAWFRKEWKPELKAYLQAMQSQGASNVITLGSYSGRNKHTEEEEMELWGYEKTQPFHSYMNISAYCEQGIEPPDFINSIVDLCELKFPVAEILRMQPGQMLPWHCDMYNSYRKEHGEDANVIRYVVALDDWDWGHFIGIGNSVWHQWKRGQAIYWPRYMYHCAANSGRKSLLLFTITGQVQESSLHQKPLSIFDL